MLRLDIPIPQDYRDIRASADHARLQSGYKMPRTPPKRHNRGDMLTRQSPGGNWVINFRVPPELRGVEPFGGREVFRKSTGTRNYKEACDIRDAFLEQSGFHEPARDREESRNDRKRGDAEHYFRALHSIERSVGEDELRSQMATIEGYAQDLIEDGATRATSSALRKYEAQAEAYRHILNESGLSPARAAELPHPYHIDVVQAAENLAKQYKLDGKAEKTIAKVRNAAKRYVEFAGSSVTLDGIRKPAVRRFINERKSAGGSEASVQNELSFLGSAFSHAQAEGYLADGLKNPFREHRLGGFPPPTKRRVYTAEQAIDLLKLTLTDVDVFAAIQVAYYSGMRLSEVFSSPLVERNGVKVWSVAADGTGKTPSSTRLVPIHERCIASLTELGLLPTVGNAIPWSRTPTHDALGKRFGRIKAEYFKAEGISDHAMFTFHSFRHGFTTLLIAKDYSELQIADITGHDRSGRAFTEAGRTYFQDQDLPKRAEMIKALPPIPTPSELGFTIA